MRQMQEIDGWRRVGWCCIEVRSVVACLRLVFWKSKVQKYTASIQVTSELIMSSKRKLQQAYKEVEDLKSKENDAREEFEELQKKVKKAKAMVQDLQIDLVKQNKIK